MVGVKNTFSSKDFYSKGKGELGFFSYYYEKQPENCASLSKVFTGGPNYHNFPKSSIRRTEKQFH